MLQITFFKIVKEDIGGSYPRAAPVVKTEQKENVVTNFSTQQRPTVNLSDAWLVPVTYRGRVANTGTRV